MNLLEKVKVFANFAENLDESLEKFRRQLTKQLMEYHVKFERDQRYEIIFKEEGKLKRIIVDHLCLDTNWLESTDIKRTWGRIPVKDIRELKRQEKSLQA